MAKVRRGNVVLRVEDFEIQHYLNLGYNLVDENGSVIRRSIPNNLGELQTAYIENQKKIAQMEQIIANLTAELEAAKAVADKYTKKIAGNKSTKPTGK